MDTKITGTPASLEASAARQSPYKLAHVICLTDRIDVMRDWYAKVLNATVAFENANLCFMRYDDEHHRIGFIRADGLQPEPDGPTRSIHHYSFTYRDLGELFGNYLRLRSAGIEPFWCVNHGPTTSMYYRDPDGHRVELQVDNMTNDEVDAFFAAGSYEQNPIGVIFDPDQWIGRLLAGEPASKLAVREPLPAGTTPWDMIRN
jgi:catechol 2,3-dioxygenase-like lactoylglutathione lyase family enzyme